MSTNSFSFMDNLRPSTQGTSTPAGKKPRWRYPELIAAERERRENRRVQSFAKYLVKRCLWWAEHQRRRERRFGEGAGFDELGVALHGRQILFENYIEYVLLNEYPRLKGCSPALIPKVEQAVRILAAQIQTGIKELPR